MRPSLAQEYVSSARRGFEEESDSIPAPPPRNIFTSLPVGSGSARNAGHHHHLLGKFGPPSSRSGLSSPGCYVPKRHNSRSSIFHGGPYDTAADGTKRNGYNERDVNGDPSSLVSRSLELAKKTAWALATLPGSLKNLFGQKAEDSDGGSPADSASQFANSVHFCFRVEDDDPAVEPPGRPRTPKTPTRPAIDRNPPSARQHLLGQVAPHAEEKWTSPLASRTVDRPNFEYYSTSSLRYPRQQSVTSQRHRQSPSPLQLRESTGRSSETEGGSSLLRRPTTGVRAADRDRSGRDDQHSSVESAVVGRLDVDRDRPENNAVVSATTKKRSVPDAARTNVSSVLKMIEKEYKDHLKADDFKAFQSRRRGILGSELKRLIRAQELAVATRCLDHEHSAFASIEEEADRQMFSMDGPGGNPRKISIPNNLVGNEATPSDPPTASNPVPEGEDHDEEAEPDSCSHKRRKLPPEEPNVQVAQPRPKPEEAKHGDVAVATHPPARTDPNPPPPSVSVEPGPMELPKPVTPPLAPAAEPAEVRAPTPPIPRSLTPPLRAATPPVVTTPPIFDQPADSQPPPPSLLSATSSIISNPTPAPGAQIFSWNQEENLATSSSTSRPSLFSTPIPSYLAVSPSNQERETSQLPTSLFSVPSQNDVGASSLAAGRDLKAGSESLFAAPSLPGSLFGNLVSKPPPSAGPIDSAPASSTPAPSLFANSSAPLSPLFGGISASALANTSPTSGNARNPSTPLFGGNQQGQSTSHQGIFSPAASMFNSASSHMPQTANPATNLFGGTTTNLLSEPNPTMSSSLINNPSQSPFGGTSSNSTGGGTGFFGGLSGGKPTSPMASQDNKGSLFGASFGLNSGVNNISSGNASTLFGGPPSSSASLFGSSSFVSSSSQQQSAPSFSTDGGLFSSQPDISIFSQGANSMNTDPSSQQENVFTTGKPQTYLRIKRRNKS